MVDRVSGVDRDFILTSSFDYSKEAFQPLGQIGSDVTPQGFNSTAADSELLAVVPAHAPEDKAQSHGDRLTATDRAVADNTFAVLKLRAVPPRQRQILPFAELLVNH